VTAAVSDKPRNLHRSPPSWKKGRRRIRGVALDRDPEKWTPVFRKDHASKKKMTDEHDSTQLEHALVQLRVRAGLTRCIGKQPRYGSITLCGMRPISPLATQGTSARRQRMIREPVFLRDKREAQRSCSDTGSRFNPIGSGSVRLPAGIPRSIARLGRLTERIGDPVFVLPGSCRLERNPKKKTCRPILKTKPWAKRRH
jgi:hypothetical protein